MSRNCRSCHRELAQEQQDCPYCGAPQNLLSYYRSRILVVILLGLGVVWAGNLFIKQQVAARLDEVQASSIAKIAETERQLANALAAQEAIQQKLTDAEAQLNTLQQQLASANQTASEQSGNTQKELNRLKAEAKRQSDRAGWLGRENARLMKELEKVKQQLVESQQAASKVTQPIVSSSAGAFTNPVSTGHSDDENNTIEQGSEKQDKEQIPAQDGNQAL